MKNSAALSIAGAGTLWGLIGLFVNLLAAKGFAPLQITTLRVTAALLFTALIIWRTDIRQFFIRPKDWWMFFGNGVIDWSFSTGVTSTPSQAAAWPSRLCCFIRRRCL